MMSLENVLIELIDSHLAANKDNTLIFNEEIGAFWTKSEWKLTNAKLADPLSLLLVAKNPERVSDMDDNITIATVAKLIEKPAWYVKSFSDGWVGSSNSHMSIEAHLLGAKLRTRYLPKGTE